MDNTVELLQHQVEGIQWMLEMEDSPHQGGIIGDEMGMGKTRMVLQVVRLTGAEARRTLVVVPKAVLHQWSDEARRVGLLVSVFYAPNTRRSPRGNLVLTTYETVARHIGVMETVVWDRLILDEAHRIRSEKSLTFRAIFRLQALRRWSVSGTLLQNRVSDLIPQIRFLRLYPHCVYRCSICRTCESDEKRGAECHLCGCPNREHSLVFTSDILSKLIPGSPQLETAKQDLDQLVGRIMLRRTKDLIGMAPPVEHSISVTLSEAELTVYEELEAWFVVPDSGFMACRAFAQILRLRQLCSSAGHGTLCTFCLQPFQVHEQVLSCTVRN
jgi:SNF2 family DNA or RNA helicase